MSTIIKIGGSLTIKLQRSHYRLMLCTKMSTSVPKIHFYVTTPIYYANASPHIGHLYSSVIADAAQRFDRLVNSQPTLLSSGVDEHGTKVLLAAASRNVQEYCDGISQQYKRMLDVHQVDCGQFTRTTSDTHKTAVISFWKNLETRNFIYKGTYTGWYSVADEAFVPDCKVTGKDGEHQVSLETGRKVELIEEQNYMFCLKNMKDDLLYWLQNGERVVPSKFHHLLQTFVHELTDDVSISRPANRVPWGIPVPDDPSQTVYVWLDALVNYLTAVGYPDKLTHWPPDLHVVGKDILRFHGLLWPALLIAAGLEPPKKILCHSHWKVDGEKMSKTKNNVVDPCGSEAALLTPAGMRYFLLREGVAHSDGNFSIEQARLILNAELADKLGNLLSRCTASTINADQTWPSLTDDGRKLLTAQASELAEAMDHISADAKMHYTNFEFHKVVDAVVFIVMGANRFFETMRPWELEHKSERKAAVISITMEVLRVAGIVLQPIIPELSELLLNKLSIPLNERKWDSIQPLLWKRSQEPARLLLGSQRVLFSRIKKP